MVTLSALRALCDGNPSITGIIHRSPVDYPKKGQQCGVLWFPGKIEQPVGQTCCRWWFETPWVSPRVPTPKSRVWTTGETMYMWWWSFWSSVSDSVTLQFSDMTVMLEKINLSCTKRKCCHLINFCHCMVKSRVSVITLTMAGFPAYSILFHVTTNAHWASNWSLLTEARMSVLMASNTEASVLLAERFRAPWYTPRSSFWTTKHTWWRHQMETFSSLLALCAGNSPVTGEFPA